MNMSINNNRILDIAEKQASEYESFESRYSANSSNKTNTKAKKVNAQKIDKEKKQAMKMEVAAKQSTLLALESKNRGGKNSRKKTARLAFVLSEREQEQEEVPTEIFRIGIKSERVSLKRSMRKPGHGDRSGKVARFVDEYSAGSCKFKSLEYLIDIYENELKE